MHNFDSRSLGLKSYSFRRHSLCVLNRLQQVMRLAGCRFPKRLPLFQMPPLTTLRGLSEINTRSASTSKSTTPPKGDVNLEQVGGGRTSGSVGTGGSTGAPGPTKAGVYAGGAEMPFTSRLHIADPSKAPVRPWGSGNYYHFYFLASIILCSNR